MVTVGRKGSDDEAAAASATLWPCDATVSLDGLRSSFLSDVPEWLAADGLGAVAALAGENR
jgi:hypothetical protein